VPNGCTGGGVWGAPTIDAANGTIYFATGNAGACSSSETFPVSLIEVKAADLSLVQYWHVPSSEQTVDGDFGSSATLFTATITGVVTQMVGISNKNGIYYAFNRNNISTGPVWRARVAKAGSCPQCGDGSISPAAWDGTTLYVAGGNTTIRGINCKGGLRAVNPATGAFIWEHCMYAGPILGAVSAVPGVIVVGEGNFVIVVDAVTSTTLFRYQDPNANSVFWGAASISNGVLYIGNQDGLYAFGL
jgi:polyvinyl alcohol dehydrogenase (cytochrome)